LDAVLERLTYVNELTEHEAATVHRLLHLRPGHTALTHRLSL
jgi:hypothetical protein